MTEKKAIQISVPALMRVEGEGALELSIRDNDIADLKLRIYEPPRYFEQFLVGRHADEVLDIVARICGICPVAYQMSAVQAIESAFGIDVNDWVRAMRRVFYCGEWLQSHSLHVHLLAVPDFLGFHNVVDMAEKFPREVRRGLFLQGLGNRLISLFGARSVHPVGACIGGFTQAPEEAAVEALLPDLHQGLAEAGELIRWAAQLSLPDEEQDFISLCLNTADYPFMQGDLLRSDGETFSVKQFEQRVREFQVPHSTAFHATMEERPYLVGPLARINSHYDKLPPELKKRLREQAIDFPSKNMFHSLLARCAEIWLALYEASSLLTDYRKPGQSHVDYTPRQSVGYGCSEAPRGVLWHKYEFDSKGYVRAARIVPPTSQNQARIEEDLRRSLKHYGLQHSDDQLRLHGEKVIRNYDPCISCATHFLKLDVQRC